MQWLGNYKEDEILRFLWSTNAANGSSITRAVNGEVRVYKDNGVGQSTVGITDTEDFDGLTGIHACTIDLSADTFYATGADYSVVLQGATIDGQVVNAVLAHFSIENRFDGVDEIGELISAAKNMISFIGLDDGGKMKIRIVEYDGNNNPIYIGKAEVRAAENQFLWIITKITYDANNNPTNIQTVGTEPNERKRWDLRMDYL